MAKARAKMIGISAQKLRLVMDEIRGKRVEDALAYLRYMTTPSAKQIYKVVHSAAANAENNDLQDRDALVITNIVADQAPQIRRFRARARGRSGRFFRPTAHITVEVDEALT